MPSLHCIKYVSKGRRIGCILFPEITDDCPSDCPFFISGSPLEASLDIRVDCLHFDRLKDGTIMCIETGQVEAVICSDCSKFEKRESVLREDSTSAA
ncbi:MAG: hypothetical protein ACFFCZ_26920 [Promethearchaeota archaeon]